MPDRLEIWLVLVSNDQSCLQHQVVQTVNMENLGV